MRPWHDHPRGEGNAPYRLLDRSARDRLPGRLPAGSEGARRWLPWGLARKGRRPRLERPGLEPSRGPPRVRQQGNLLSIAARLRASSRTRQLPGPARAYLEPRSRAWLASPGRGLADEHRFSGRCHPDPDRCRHATDSQLAGATDRPDRVRCGHALPRATLSFARPVVPGDGAAPPRPGAFHRGARRTSRLPDAHQPAAVARMAFTGSRHLLHDGCALADLVRRSAELDPRRPRNREALPLLRRGHQRADDAEADP